MINLLEETIDFLKSYSKTEDDIYWVGSKNICFSWKHFENIANFSYDSGYGAQEVANDLIIFGHDFWLERKEYDGSEWWEYKQIPVKPVKEIEVKKVIGGMWNNLEEINEEETENV